MKLTTGSRLKTVLASLLIAYSLAGFAQPDATEPDKTHSTSKRHPIAGENRSDTSNQAKHSKPYSGYSVDGRTSASVIAAKRSHTVATEDERGLAIYSGLIVTGLIVFFVHALSKRK